MSRKYTSADRQKSMGDLLKTPAGRSHLAKTVTEPLRQLRDYSAVARRALMEDALSDGMLSIYDKDPEMRAYVVGEEGSSIQQVVKSDRLHIPTFELAIIADVPFTQIKQRRFDVTKRIKEKTKSEMFREEDRIIFRIMTTAAELNQVNSMLQPSEFTVDYIIDAFSRIERHGLRVDKMFMNATTYRVFRKAGKEYLDDTTQRELLRTGQMATIHGATIHVSPEMPERDVLICAEPEFVGIMPIVVDLTVLPADDPRKRQFGWSVFQSFGVGIHNSDRGLQLLRVSGTSEGRDEAPSRNLINPTPSTTP